MPLPPSYSLVMVLRSLLPGLATTALLVATIAGVQAADWNGIEPFRGSTGSPLPTVQPAAEPGPPGSEPAAGVGTIEVRPDRGAAGDLITLSGVGCNNPGGAAIIVFGTSSYFGMPGTLFGSVELGRFSVRADGSFIATARVPFELRPIQGTGGGPVVAGTYEIYSKPASLCRAAFHVTAPVTVFARPSALGAFFDSAPEYPGYQWTRHGRHAVRGFELTTAAGPGHCELQSATFLTIGWPLGTVSRTSAEARQFIRDPRGVVRPGNLQHELDLHATLPSDARPSGYRYADLEIYFSPSDQDSAVYVVGQAGAERWPRSDPMTLCI